MSDHYPAQIHFVYYFIEKSLPIHAHNALVKVNDNDIIYAEAALEYVFSVLGAVYERNSLVENQIVRVDIEGEYRGLSPGFISTLLNHINKRSMAYMDAVKKTERHYFLFCHQLTS